MKEIQIIKKNMYEKRLALIIARKIKTKTN